MLRSVELRQEVQKRTKELSTIMVKLAEESRTSFDEAERTRVNELRKEIEDLDEQIAAAELIEQRQQAAADGGNGVTIAGGNPAGQGEANEMRKAVRGFRITRALSLQLRGKPIDGLEAEMTQEAAKEARDFGQSVEGVAVPGEFMREARKMERRTATAGTPTNLGHSVDTDLQNDLIGSLRPNPRIIGLGARRLEGLTSNVEFLRVTDNTVSKWKGETADAEETDAAVDLLEMSPKRLTAYTQFSRQVLIQSSIPDGVEAFLREDLRKSDELALDAAAINGSGAGSVPQGILNVPGTTTVALGANGAAIIRAKLIAMIRALATKNVDVETLAYLSTPEVAAELMNTPINGTGSDRFLLESMMGTLMGYRTAFSTQVPNDLTKGTGTDLSAMIFGNFREVIVCSWGGRQVLVDPYTQAVKGMVRIVTHGFHDVGVRRPQSFAVIKDIDTSATAPA